MRREFSGLGEGGGDSDGENESGWGGEGGGLEKGVEGTAARGVEWGIHLWDQRRVVGWLDRRSEECVCFGGDILILKILAM